ncbi:class I SAM-dependent methyltransferase [Streptomyces litchfieldiae]|uniref:Class I SAM-dependent methyltransferase n=1 Tax=Streptomyces litchfieldiae TaxID=3075543 RepID=A0ABU2MYT6_9ACTN|nr:class I SAM-dependent methyltransferase [Streptomyces sp. DSM 44938]MDT0346822.1 class I SAM-dependent methyltransferase [Streptomyces sp. DSM 44938]
MRTGREGDRGGPGARHGGARRAGGPAAEVRLAALPGLPFADGKFDAVLANFVLNHAGRPRAALTELRRVTHPGGRIAVTVWARTWPTRPGKRSAGTTGRHRRSGGAARLPAWRRSGRS